MHLAGVEFRVYKPWISRCIVGPSISPVDKVSARVQGSQGDSVLGRRDPSELDILSVSPNPSRNMSRVTMALYKRGETEVSLADASGRTKAVLLHRVLDAGRHSIAVDFDELGLSSGLYWLCLKSDKEMIAREIIILSDGSKDPRIQ